MGDENQNYGKMYYEMARAVEKTIRILIEVQQKCEEMYISQDEKKSGDE